MKRKKSYYHVKYSSGRTAITSWKVRKGKAKGEAGQMGVRVVSVKKIKKPTWRTRLKSW